MRDGQIFGGACDAYAQPYQEQRHEDISNDGKDDGVECWLSVQEIPEVVQEVLAPDCYCAYDSWDEQDHNQEDAQRLYNPIVQHGLVQALNQETPQEQSYNEGGQYGE